MTSRNKTKKKRTIVHVEDEEMLVEFVAHLLQREGFDYLSAGNAKEALALLEKVTPDLVILDLVFPGSMSGLELLKIIKSLSAPPPVVVLSAFYNAEVIRDCYRFGAFSFISKPFEWAELLNVINDAIAQHPNTIVKKEASREKEVAHFSEPALSALAEITGGFCHDLGNSLLAISGYLELAGEISPEVEKSQDVNRALEIIQSINVALRDLQQFVHMFYKQDESPAAVLTKENIEPALWDMFRPVVDLEFIKLQVEVAPFKRELYIERILLRNLLIPILANANKAIQGQSNSGRISVKLYPLDDLGDLRIVVSDDGPGWQDKLEEIKDRISKGTSFFAQRRTGGLGLPNLNLLVRKLGGSLILSEDPSGGACVEIRLPGDVCYAQEKPD